MDIFQSSYHNSFERLAQTTITTAFPDNLKSSRPWWSFLGKINSKYTTMDVFLGIFLNFSKQLKFLGNFLCDL